MRNTESIYREALQQIAAGEGYYGAQAREYKSIAKSAIAEGDAVVRAKEVARIKARRGLNCGVILRAGKWECVCGECPTQGERNESAS